MRGQQILIAKRRPNLKCALRPATCDLSQNTKCNLFPGKWSHFNFVTHLRPIWGCSKLVTINCYNVTTLQHLFVVTNTVTTFISCNSIISTHNCYIQIFVVISKYLLLQRQRKVVTQIFVVTMSGICSDKSRGRGTFGSSSPPPSPTPSPWVCCASGNQEKSLCDSDTI